MRAAAEQAKIVVLLGYWDVKREFAMYGYSRNGLVKCFRDSALGVDREKYRPRTALGMEETSVQSSVCFQARNSGIRYCVSA